MASATNGTKFGQENESGLDHGLLYELVGHLLRHAFNRGQTVFADVFRDDGITPLQFMILELVSKNAGINHATICEEMGAAASVVTTTMKPLIAQGYILSEASRRDRRVNCYSLSEGGQSRFHEIRPKILECEDRFTQSLTVRQREDLLKSLRSIAGFDN